MRVISGKFKGRRLTSFKAEHIRPTTDRVKESLFNIIAMRLEQARVLDLFSGTGSLGIEALSRGCRHVVFVESHKTSLRIIKENLRQLEITTGFEIVPRDVFQVLAKTPMESFDVVLIDPPFTKKIAHDVMSALAESHLTKLGGVVAIESAAKEKIEDSYGPLNLQTRRLFGDKILSIFTCTAGP